MCIPPSMLQKLADYYEENGQLEKAALQRESIKRRAKAIESRADIAGNRQQQNKKNLLDKKIAFSFPCQTTLKLIGVAAILALTAIAIYSSQTEVNG